MFSSQAIKQDFSRAASRYDEAAQLQRRVRACALAPARECWPEGSAILDAGCGTGALAADAKGFGWRIVGIDVASGMCAAARRNCAVVNADAGALPFAGASFDGVFSSLMLQWVMNPLGVFQEMARVIAPGGSCVVSTLLPGTLRELEAAFATLDDAPHVSRFTPEAALLSAAAAAGLKAISATEKTIVNHHPDAEALMRSIKSIGAVNKASARRRGLMTPQRMAQLEQAYARFGGAQGIPATWKVLYMVMRRV
ncbi:MAG: methyltransferase domain-containing protein [Pseudomonadota bacterium]|nr:methyltransferase domain-containing protein [Pseudomonadota bacterium]MDE3038476.1 methyltransferase domain-containing protein [Pseudomonadota bacterium]